MCPKSLWIYVYWCKINSTTNYKFLKSLFVMSWIFFPTIIISCHSWTIPPAIGSCSCHFPNKWQLQWNKASCKKIYYLCSNVSNNRLIKLFFRDLIGKHFLSSPSAKKQFLVFFPGAACRPDVRCCNRPAPQRHRTNCRAAGQLPLQRAPGGAAGWHAALRLAGCLQRCDPGPEAALQLPCRM